MNQEGDVFQANNISPQRQAMYEGLSKVPPAESAFLRGHKASSDLTAPFPDFAKRQVGNDGQEWLGGFGP